MFAWLGDIEAALKEIPDLEKALYDLRGELFSTQDKTSITKTKLEILHSKHSGAEAQTENIISPTNIDATATREDANADAALKTDQAPTKLAEIHKIKKKKPTDHNELMENLPREKDTMRTQVDELNAEPTTIKTRL